jgi:translation initiation factor IF-2
MSETKDTTGDDQRAGAPATPAGPAGAAAPARKPLSLKRTVDAGSVRQTFGQGRSKAVVVEKKKTRKVGNEVEEARKPSAPVTTTVAAAETALKDAVRLGGLSNSEVDQRRRALEAARSREETEAAERAEREAQEKARAAELAAARKIEEDELRAQGMPVPDPVVESLPEVVAAAADETPAPAAAAPAPTVASPSARPATGGQPARTGFVARDAQAPAARTTDRTTDRPTEPTNVTRRPDLGTVIKRPTRVNEEGEDDERRIIKKGPGGTIIKAPVKTPAKVAEERRERIKLTINNAFDEQQRERSLASLKRKREREKLKAMGISQTREKVMREVIIPEAITIQELANRMTERSVDVIKLMMKQGAMHQINDVIDADTAELIVTEFGHTPKRVSESDVEEGFFGDRHGEENEIERAPVVTIMGHVDHGKTSLLDAIRQTNVVSGEAGGITQHIGAYQVLTPNGHKVTFIDTPGHEAFTAMRARGAKVTDIVVLVVAADDGVMPQTIEAINHAKAAGVPMIVAINKIDKPQSDPNRVRTELLQHEVVVESMSGDVLDVPVSALKKTGLDKLLEAIELQAEILQLKSNPDRSADGYVIEAKLERGRGPVGTVLVQRGTLRVGDLVVAGMAWGRVRALLDDQGQPVKDAGPSVPVEILGFDSAPEAGDQFAVVENEAKAREITDYRIRKRRETHGSAGTKSTLEQMMQQLKEAGRKEFTLLVKGDVQGSVEAIAGALKKVGNEEVQARIIHSGVGAISESDIALASASKAIVIGFNVRANEQAKRAADVQGIEIRYYTIIYDLVDEVKGAMSGLLAPTRKENFLGNATIKQVFNISKVGKIAGCQVKEGRVERGAKVRLLRDNVIIHEGTLSVLKRFKDEVKEVPAGQECGMAFANYQDIREGDIIECFNVEIIKRSL